jgi:hypothetical protein
MSEHVEVTTFIKQTKMKKTLVVNGQHNKKNVFLCESECLYVEKLTYVQQTEIKNTVAINGHHYKK